MVAALCAYRGQSWSVAVSQFRASVSHSEVFAGSRPLLAIFSPALLFWRGRCCRELPCGGSEV